MNVDVTGLVGVIIKREGSNGMTKWFLRDVKNADERCPLGWNRKLLHNGPIKSEIPDAGAKTKGAMAR